MVLWIPATIVRDVIPDYLKSIPIPYNFGDVKSMSLKDVAHLAIVTGAIGATVHFGILPLLEKDPKDGQINKDIMKEKPKVVEVVNVEDIPFKEKDRVCYCRCWRSKSWPYCDGSHNAHNTLTGDNVAPLVIKK